MLVKDIMNKEVVKVTSLMPFIDLINMFKDFHSFPLIPVVDDSNKLVGRVSQECFYALFEQHTSESRRLMRAMPFIGQEEQVDIFKAELVPEVALLLVVDDIMDNRVASIHEGSGLEEAFNLMKQSGKSNVAVVNDKKELTGVLGTFDIFLELLRERDILK